MTTQSLDVRTKDGVKFGKELREKEYLFGEGWLNLNHGSFGTYPRCVREKLRSFQDAAEARPDHFIRYQYPKLLDASREAMAKLLNTPSSTLVFLPNATTGINTVLRNLSFPPRSSIVYFSSIYGACEKTISYITETTPASAVKIQFTYPVEDDWLVAEFKRVVAKKRADGGEVVIAVFDTVVSMPGVRVPFEALTQACRELGVLSCIDGAHAVGHIDVNLGELDPDFFVSNCHKWLNTPRGSAIFHVPARNQHIIRSTLPTSHGFVPHIPTGPSPFPKSAFVDASRSPFTANFEFVGTIDSAPYLCVPTALAFRESLGGEAVIREYCWTLAREAAAYVAKELGTEVMENGTETLGRCCMAMVRLPIDVAKAMDVAVKGGVKQEDVGLDVRDWMSKTSVDDYQTFIQTMWYEGVWWTRLSAQVYLEMKDFEWAAETLKKICERVDGGEWAVGQGKQ